MPPAPQERVTLLNDAPLRPDRSFVLYWMIASRRTQFNFALQHAIHEAQQLQKPLLIFEPLRVSYRWASLRLHRFVSDGMVDNARSAAEHGIAYFPYLEPREGAASGLLEALAAHACEIITDEFPCFFLPKLVQVAAKKSPVRLMQVDSNGLLPLRAASRAYPTAAVFRRHLQKTLPEHLRHFPVDNPLAHHGLPRLQDVPGTIRERWPAATPQQLDGSDQAFWNALPIDQTVRPTDTRGGSRSAAHRLDQFLEVRLTHYAEDRNQPEKDVASGLSPYLHFGHIATHHIVAAAFERAESTLNRSFPKPHGAKEGWWGLDPSTESFLDELITWRELGYNVSFHCPDTYDRYESLPTWARQTLEHHQNDPRETVYSLEQFTRAQTHDELWNAAQTQLVREGTIHNYLRMLWGKKILEWTRSPREALEIMIELNNRYAIDGRDPNSYSGIFWILGRFDRPWFPERKIFGTVRYMSSTNTARKVRVKQYIARYREQQLNLV